MAFRREPKLEPLSRQPAAYEHVLLVAPVWNAKLAHPMKAFVKRERQALARYSFITLCGYERPGQSESLARERQIDDFLHCAAV